MKLNIRNMPISIGGSILGITAMGNLFHDYFCYSREICGFIATLFLILVLVKLIKYPKIFKEDLNNPVLASIIATLSMSLMLLSNYVYPYIGISAIYLWIFAIIIHVIFVINYIAKFLVKIDVSNFTAGSFVVFAGIQMITITAPTFNQEAIGSIAFWISFIFVLMIFVIVTYRYLKIPIVKQIKPIIGVYAAPFSLCAVGYLASVSPKNFYLVIGFYIVTKILYVMVLIKFVEYKDYPFFPTFASYTFPIVINTITTLQTMKYLTNIGINLMYLQYELMIEIVIAILLVTYVSGHFIINIIEIPRLKK